ncbi:MAG: metal ABC transporter permease, partial [Muribaculaceae bacterium]|nr:metal ABC transporter permease [Muribaculaceae bacterium]
VLMIRCVGMMLLMSMLSLPQLTAELFCSRLKTMIPVAVAISLAGCVGGLVAATAVNVPASALIVALQVAVYALGATARRLLPSK